MVSSLGMNFIHDANLIPKASISEVEFATDSNIELQ